MNKKRVKALLVSALQNAVEYEESKLDAGTDMGDKAAIREMKNNIRAWQKWLDVIYPNRPMTLRQYLNALPDKAFISVTELINTTDSKDDTTEGK